MNPLVLLLILPLIGAVVTALMPSARGARQMSFFGGLLTLAVAIYIAASFYGTSPHADFNYIGMGLPTIGFSFHLGIDGISLWLILLTSVLMPLSILFSFSSIKVREKEYYAWMLAMHVAMLGVFCARDLLLFYVFFELTLIPMFFIIGIWGGPERRYAAAKFFLFTFAGSVFTLTAIIYLGIQAQTFDIATIVQYAQTGLTGHERLWVVLGLIAGFAVKVPLFPVHTWLPLAHTEAPTAGSVILAGVLLKLGTYGFIRLALPIGLVFRSGGPVTYEPHLIFWLGVLCLIGIIYGSLVAWVQQDIKKLVAYSSVAHLGFCILGILALNDIGMQGSVLYMINHGINTGAMFLCIGMIYERYHTRDINQLSGLARRMPILSFFFVFFTLASIGLPGTNGFVSEFLTILGAFTSIHLGIGFGVIAAIGIILGALYMLHMVARIIFGPLKTPVLDDHGHDAAEHAHHSHATPGDIGGREIGILVPLAILVIVLGVQPGLATDTFRAPVQALRTPAVAIKVPGGPTTTPSILPVVVNPSVPSIRPSVSSRHAGAVAQATLATESRVP